MEDTSQHYGTEIVLGFCNYYKKFIIKQLDKIEWFIKIIKKDKLWNWTKEYIKLFKKVKKEFIKEFILKIY